MMVIGRHAGRWLGGASRGHVDDEGLVDRLTAGEVGVDGVTHVLLGPQGAFACALAIAGHNAQGNVWRVEAPAQRVCILFEDHVAHVVDQVVLSDLDERGRGIGPLDPDLAVQHAGGAGCRRRRASVVDGRGWA